MRAVTHRVFAAHLGAGDRVLDLCCGTGPDFPFWRGLGVRLTGVDLSPNMLARAEEKHPAATLHRLDLADLDQLSECFDGICTNFGGLNTIGDLGALGPELARLTRPGGVLIANVMGPWPLREIAGGLMRARHLLRRARHPPGAPLTVGERPVPTWYHTPRSLGRPLETWFHREAVIGLGVFLPPPDGPQRSPSRPIRFLERVLAPRFPFNRMGDHTLVVMRRRRDG